MEKIIALCLALLTLVAFAGSSFYFTVQLVKTAEDSLEHEGILKMLVFAFCISVFILTGMIHDPNTRLWLCFVFVVIHALIYLITERIEGKKYYSL